MESEGSQIVWRPEGQEQVERLEGQHDPPRKEEPTPSQDSQRNLRERTDDGQRMSNLKCLEIGALVYHSGVAMRQSKSKDCPKVTLGNIRRAIIEEVIGLVNIPRDGGELKNPRTNQRDRKCVDRQREKNTGVRGIGIHVNGKLGGSLCQHHPEDEGEDGNTVDGDRQAVKRDRNCHQSTRRGGRNRHDNRHVESRLSFNFECEFYARSVWQREK
jgi:hypothetical protein